MYISKTLKCSIPSMFQYMMTSSNGNIICVTGHLCEEFTGHEWIPRTKVNDKEFWWVFLSVPEQTIG